MKKLIIGTIMWFGLCFALIAFCLYADISRVYELQADPHKVYIDKVLLDRLPSNCYSFTNPERVNDCQPHFIGEQNAE